MVAGTEFLAGVAFKKNEFTYEVKQYNNDSTYKYYLSQNNKKQFGPLIGLVPSFGVLLDWDTLNIGLQLEMPITADYYFSPSLTYFDFNVHGVTTKISMGLKLT